MVLPERKCGLCQADIPPDEYEEVRDLLAVELGEAWKLMQKANPDAPPAVVIADDLLRDDGVCSECWHRQSAKASFSDIAMQMVTGELMRSALFQWKEVTDD